MTELPEDAPASPFADPEYRVAIVDLLGGLAYTELSAFERMVADASGAPSLADTVQLSSLAVREFAHFEGLRDRLAELGADPFAAMQPFESAVDEFHAHTAPKDWLESLVKAYVGDGLAADFYREVAAYVDTGTRSLILEALDNAGTSDYFVTTIRQGIAEDPKRSGRLALWARRLMGEAMTQAQRVAAERDELTALLVGGVDRPGMDLAAIGRMFARLAETHTQRMSSLGLQA